MVFLISSLAGLGKPALPKNGVLDLDMSTFVVAEQSKDASAPDMMTMSFNMTPLVGLRDAVVAIRTAAEDPGIQYILLRADEASLGVADAEELRAALSSFRESGKAVVAYVENPSNASFYLSTVADKIYMGSHHGGTSQLIGISSQMIFLKDVLDKLGVNVQLIRHGKDKSAGEMFIKSSASP
jgi:protease-4